MTRSKLLLGKLKVVRPKIKMVLKKIDNRVRLLIENGVSEKHRTMFFVVGDHAKDQVCFRANQGS